jgi:Type II secretion system (T2SS), protein M subtype b
MSNLAPIRRRFTIAAVVLGCIVLALLGYLLWPRTGQMDKGALTQTRDNLARDVQKITDPAQTREDLKQLYAKDIPDRFSTISEELEKLFKQIGVTQQAIKYTPEMDQKAALPGVQQIKVETTVTGDYLKVARLVNALEQSQLLFIIDKISLSSQEGGKVSLQITFDAFLKQTA